MRAKKIFMAIWIVVGRVSLLLALDFYSTEIVSVGKFLAKSILSLVIFGVKAIAGIILCWLIILFCLIIIGRFWEGERPLYEKGDYLQDF